MDERIALGRELYGMGVRLGGLGTVAVGSGGGPLARMLARLVGCGAALAGGAVKFFDGSCAACGAWLRRYYGLPACVFVRQEEERVEIYLLDGQEGRSVPVGTVRVLDPSVTEWDLLAGSDCAWAASRAGDRRRQGVVSAHGPTALTLTLERQGYEVLNRPAPGTPLFEADREGFRLRVEQDGAEVYPDGEDALAAAAELILTPQAIQPRPEAIPAFQPEQGGAEEK